MSTKIGNLDLVGVRFGSDEVTAIYAGTDLVYSSYNYKEKYLTLVPTTASSTFQFSQTGLSYSLDSGSTWTALEASTNTPSVGVGDKIMFKGTITPTSNGIGKFSSSSDFDAEGNIMSLLYGDNFIGETSLSGKSYAFFQLFYQSSVVSANNLVLLATTLAESCYSGMFTGCRSLTVAPKLPAMTLADNCYYSMFWGCTSLTTVPSNMLQATTLATSCYSNMFRNCTSLTTAPELLATTLANQCYQNMFQGCTSLTVAPTLSATTMAESCYHSMFKGCTSLIEAPQLPATTLVSNCYDSMFSGCTSLTAITCLATDISASYCTYYWVNGVAASGTFTKANEMSGWTIDSVNGVPSGWTVQDITPSYENQYVTFIPISADTTFQFTNAGLSYSLDNGRTWTSLNANTNTPSVSAGDKILFKGTITPNSSSGIGKFTASDKFDVEGNVMSLLYGDNFIGETSLSGKNGALKSLFNSNTNVVNAENFVLPATTVADYCYDMMFGYCTSLKTAPSVLPATTLGYSCYGSMFKGCTSLTTVQEDMLPATTLANYCYGTMFSGCTSLMATPVLPATTLAQGCYDHMLQTCPSLTAITCLATDITAPYCTNVWVNGVSSSGTFYKNPNMTSWAYGGSGIPNNWTVQDYNPTPPTPTFQGKWLATYTGGTTTSAECDSSSAITSGEITLTDLASVEIGSCTTSIGDSAFDSCTSLTSIDIPNSVTTIGGWAFINCSSLASVTIGSGVTSIGDFAFTNCYSLTSVTIGSSVATIGESAFFYCPSLTSITIYATTPPTLGSGAFDDTNNCPIYVPAASLSAYQSASGWSNYTSRLQSIPL